jgi:LacI family transcriptional regulator
MRSKSIGIRDVAECAGVSIATVSRALNNPEVVRPASRARIEAAIAQLGYFPDAAARALSSGRTRTIGAIVPTVDNVTFARGIDALQRYLATEGYLLLLATSSYEPDIEFKQARNMISRGVDGLVLIGDLHSESLRRLLAAQHIPFINVSVYLPDKPYASVGIDNDRAGYRACRYLLDLGHRAIGMVAALTANNDRAGARVDGVRRAMAEAGLELRPEWLVEVRYKLDDARSAARSLFAMPSRPTALVCANDTVAYGVLLEAERHGLEVPRDLSIVGFDDLEWSRHLRPTLTTMSLPTEEVWMRAGEYLVNVLAGKPTELHHEVDFSLVVRESTAGPPSRPASDVRDA